MRTPLSLPEREPFRFFLDVFASRSYGDGVTVIQKLESLGYRVHRRMRDEGNAVVGLHVRNDAWSACPKCEEKYIYWLEEVRVEQVSAFGVLVPIPVRDSLARFCNGCGHFEREEGCKDMSYVGRLLAAHDDLFMVAAMLERDMRAYFDMGVEALEAEAEDLSRRLGIVGHLIAARKDPYRE